MVQQTYTTCSWVLPFKWHQEMLGYNTELKGTGGLAMDAFYALMGCTNPLGNADRGCGRSVTYVHINVEAWQEGYVDEWAQVQAPVSQGGAHKFGKWRLQWHKRDVCSTCRAAEGLSSRGHQFGFLQGLQHVMENPRELLYSPRWYGCFEIASLRGHSVDVERTYGDVFRPHRRCRGCGGWQRRFCSCKMLCGPLLVCTCLQSRSWHLLDVVNCWHWMGNAGRVAQGNHLQHSFGNGCCQYFPELCQSADGLQCHALLVGSWSYFPQARKNASWKSRCC